ncbi:hypothetical protein ABT352_06735 [Streptosporangium sp. NPDC000563]|uniref:hypothetical protein n=1 Tax=Streptosporangium sp. NPDC000563 TaxID=3154366 RepID=UPI00331D1A8B
MRILWGCLVIGAISPLVGLFLLIMIPVWRDEARLDDFHQRVLAYPLPPETRTMGDSDATVGKISGGNGDYCEYQIRLTLQTGLPQEKILAYYEKAAIAGADAREKAQVSLGSDEDIDESEAVIVEFGAITDSDWNWNCT